MRIALILLTIMLLGLGMVSAECFDSDGGKNKYDFGGVTYNGETYSDTCDGDNIKEYFCSVDGIASFTTLECVNGCEEGICVISSSPPISSAPEEEEISYRMYGYIVLIVILIGLYAYWFYIKPKRKYK
jgi:hypothetical protein